MEEYRSWFDSFTGEFIRKAVENGDKDNIRIKVDHSFRVLDNMNRITASLALDDAMRELARIVALFHDLGRFPQYMRYKTFNDGESENHALLALKVLRENGPLAALSREHRRLVLGAIWLHNRFSISPGLSRNLSLLARAIRDADKLDIFRIMVSHLKADSPRNDLVTLHLKPHPTAYTKSIAGAVRSGKLGRYEEMAWINDFTLLLCSWIYDFNFPASRKMLLDSGHFETVLALLPEERELGTLKERLREDLRKGL
jgi:hypothetical protein